MGSTEPYAYRVTIVCGRNELSYLPAGEDSDVKTFCNDMVRDRVPLGGVHRGLFIRTGDACKNEVASSGK